MDIRDGFIDSIGNTPLIKLRRASEMTGCTILGKAEFLNPGGSVKDRAALFIIKDAEERGLLRPGGVIVEGTAGNTGIGLALVGNALRLPHASSSCPRRRARKRRTCCGCAAPICGSCRPCPTPTRCNYVRYSGRLAEEIAAKPSRTARSGPTSSTTSPTGAAITRRPAPRSGSRPTARSTPSSARSAPAARLSGRRDRAQGAQPQDQDLPLRPDGLGHLQLVRAARVQAGGQLDHRGHRQQPRDQEPRRLHRPTASSRSPTRRCCRSCSTWLQEEGLILGGSTGINVCGAIRLARELGPGHTIVTILADSGTRYQSKLFNPAFLQGAQPADPEMAGRRATA